jgi:hypothetical protein
MERPAREWRSVLRMPALSPGAVRLIREPLLHFLAIGGLLFAVHSALEPTTDEPSYGPPRIVRITDADAGWLKDMWARQWRRPPTDDELRGLVADHLHEEMLAREARELHLDVGDPVIRRRLAQKMTFLLDDTLRVSEPPESELRSLYEARPELIRTPARISFTQIFFDRRQGEDRAVGKAGMVLARLSDSSGDSAGEGDRLLLGDVFVDQDELSLANVFGAAFARAVFSAEYGRWSGPISSGYGLHLVKVTGMQPSRTPAFGEARGRLADEWHRQRQEAARDQFRAGLARKYEVVADPNVRRLLGHAVDDAGARP